MWPLCGSGGEGGSKVPLAFGWEVPVSVPRLKSRSDAEARDKASSAGRRPRKAEGNGMVYLVK